MTHDRISRRRVLAAAGGVGVAAVSVWARPWRSLVAFVPVSAAERLVGLFSHRASAEAIGSAYLARVPSEAAVGHLVDMIAAELPGGRRTVLEASDDELRSILLERVRTDFEQDRIVDVGGWVLSPTEARLYALASLV